MDPEDVGLRSAMYSSVDFKQVSSFSLLMCEMGIIIFVQLISEECQNEMISVSVI